MSTAFDPTTPDLRLMVLIAVYASNRSTFETFFARPAGLEARDPKTRGGRRSSRETLAGHGSVVASPEGAGDAGGPSAPRGGCCGRSRVTASRSYLRVAPDPTHQHLLARGAQGNSGLAFQAVWLGRCHRESHAIGRPWPAPQSHAARHRGTAEVGAGELPKAGRIVCKMRTENRATTGTPRGPLDAARGGD